MNWYKTSSKKVSYSAVVLDQNSAISLIQKMKPFIPEDWKVIAHHMTIGMGELKNKEEIDKEVELKVTGWAKDQNVLAVLVSGYDRQDGLVPHITVAVNEAGGAKPKDSNKLSGWQPLSAQINLNGIVKEVYFN